MSETVKEKKKMQIGKTLNSVGALVARWLYLILLLGAAAYSIIIWNRYILNADWSDEKKQQYVNEQSVFSFDRKGYQQALDLMKSKKDKLNNTQRFSGRDIIFPEGF